MRPNRRADRAVNPVAIIVAVLLIGAGLLVVFALAGCGSTAGTTDYWTKVEMVDVNGRQVPCVIWKSYNVGGISCDWSVR